jgi:hypothetical protein
MHTIFEQAIDRTRALVIKQLRHTYPADYCQKHGADADAMSLAAESVPIDIVSQLMPEATMLANMRLAELAGSITLELLYTDDGWIAGVDNYICANQEECTPVWDFLRALVDQHVQK